MTPLLLHKTRHARMESRIQLVSIGSTQEQLNPLLHLFRRINLRTVKRRLQIMKLIRVGFLRKQCRSVIVLKSKGDRLAIVSEIEHETIVLLWMRAIEPRKRLHRLYARERFVHVHGMQQRLIVPGLELIGANQEAIRVALNLLSNVAA